MEKNDNRSAQIVNDGEIRVESDVNLEVLGAREAQQWRIKISTLI